MHRRSLISLMLVVVMIISAGVVNASGDDGHDMKGREHTKRSTYEKHHRHPRSTKVIKLFAQQEIDEASVITADGRVFTGPDVPPEDYEITPGEVLVYRERLFRLDVRDPNNLRPRGKQIGTAATTTKQDPCCRQANAALATTGLPGAGAAAGCQGLAAGPVAAPGC